MPKRKRCLCPCNRALYGEQQIYRDSKACKSRHERDQLRKGCFPIGQVVFDTCLCGNEFITMKTKQRTTCAQFYGERTCKLATSMQRKGNKNKKGKGGVKPQSTYQKYINSPPKHTPKSKRGLHVREYCIQSTGECALYHVVSFMAPDEADHNCMGRNYTGGCYVRPSYAKQAGNGAIYTHVGFKSPATNRGYFGNFK